MKLAVVYHYCEVNSTYRDNLVYFLSTAICKNISYFFYISGECSVELPEYENVEYLYIENRNNDFGAVTEFYRSGQFDRFDTYIFVNSSVRGPFLPLYYDRDWYQVFTERLSKKTALVGSSINLLPTSCDFEGYFKENFGYNPPYIHVQTTAYALSSAGFQILQDQGFYEETKTLSKSDVVTRYEILLSQIILHNNLKIASILPTCVSFSLERAGVDFPGSSRNGDPLYQFGFYGRSLSPLESVFVKTNRNIISEKELSSYTFTSLEKHDREGLLTKDGNALFQYAAERAHAVIPLKTRLLLKMLERFS